MLSDRARPVPGEKASPLRDRRPWPAAGLPARGGTLLLWGAVLLLAACSQSRATGFVRPEFFAPDRRIAFASDGPLAQALTSELGARGFRIVERAQLVKVLDEQALRQTGVLQEERTLAAGRIMNINYLIDVTEAGAASARRSAAVKILDLQSGEVVGSFNDVERGGFTFPMFMMVPVVSGKDSVVDAARRIAEAIMGQRKS
jgi:hypothetical protein